MRHGYTVRARPRGKWWAIEVVELPGIFSQAKRLEHVNDVARNAICLQLDVPAESFDLIVEPILDPPVELVVKAAVAARRDMSRAQADAAAASREAVRTLIELGLPLRDIGRLLDISHQRVAQLAGSSSRRTLQPRQPKLPRPPRPRRQSRPAQQPVRPPLPRARSPRVTIL